MVVRPTLVYTAATATSALAITNTIATAAATTTAIIFKSPNAFLLVNMCILLVVQRKQRKNHTFELRPNLYGYVGMLLLILLLLFSPAGTASSFIMRHPEPEMRIFMPLEATLTSPCRRTQSFYKCFHKSITDWPTNGATDQLSDWPTNGPTNRWTDGQT